MATIINPETHWQGSPTPPPVPDYGTLVLYGWSGTTTTLSNVTGGTVSITDDSQFVETIRMSADPTPVLPVSITITGSDVNDPGGWEITAYDAEQTELWMDGFMLGESIKITAENTPFTITFDVTALTEIIIDKTTTTTRTLASQAEFDTLSTSGEGSWVLTNVPGQAVKEFTIGQLITSIPDNFLNACRNLTTVSLTNATNLTSIGNAFLMQDSSLTTLSAIPNSVQTIGGGFLHYCSAFNAPLSLPSGLTTINMYFLADCPSFNQPVVLPSGVTSIDSYFMVGDFSFNQPITLPTGNFSVGLYFLSRCRAFNQPITLPAGMSFAKDSNAFMYRCDSMISTITILTSDAPKGKANTDYVLAAYQDSAPCYTVGIPLSGPYAQNWKTLFPNASGTGKYRNLRVVS